MLRGNSIAPDAAKAWHGSGDYVESSDRRDGRRSWRSHLLRDRFVVSDLTFPAGLWIIKRGSGRIYG